MSSLIQSAITLLVVGWILSLFMGANFGRIVRTIATALAGVMIVVALFIAYIAVILVVTLILGVIFMVYRATRRPRWR